MKLSRLHAFDDSQRRSARVDSGFGCVRCGCTIYQYWQLTDEAKGLSTAFLLCPPCGEVLAHADRGVETARKLIAHPLARQSGFDRRASLYVPALEIPDIILTPGTTMSRTVVPILFAGIPVVEFAPPERAGGAVRLSVTLAARRTAQTRAVCENEWATAEGLWKFERRGSHYRIASTDETAVLAFKVTQSGTVVIERLLTHDKSRTLQIGPEGVFVDQDKVNIPSSRAHLVGVAL
jgi:hypothetical protein